MPNFVAFPNSPFLKTNRVDPFLTFLEKMKIDFYLCTDASKADYIFLYPNRLIELYECCFAYKNKIIIFVTGEAMTPDLNLFDYAFAYDPIECGDRYQQVYFQNLMYEYSFEESQRIYPKNNKTKFCNFIYSNSRAHKIRDEFFFTLSKYNKVDSLGSHLKNVNKEISPPYKGSWFLESIREKAPYKFSIAFENTSHIGYTTEKILSSMLANTIPIYWGNKDVSKLYNNNSFINCHEFENLNEVVERIVTLNENPDMYEEMLAQPWQTADQRTLVQQQKDQLVGRINHIFKQTYSDAFRKPEGCWADIYRNNICQRHPPKKTNFISKIKQLKSRIL